MVKRYLHAVYASLNSYVEIKLADGTSAEGIFKGMDYDDCRLLFKNFVNLADETSVVQLKAVDFRDIRYLVSKDLVDPRKEAEAKPVKKREPTEEDSLVKYNFEIDTEVGTKNRKKRDKKKAMVKWNGDEGGIVNDLELDRLGGAGLSKIDQFEANKNRFGIDTEYDEESYTTKLDKNAFSNEDFARASKLANEIEKSDLREMVANRHMMEERGLVELRDYEEDEEALYSAVVRGEKKEKLKDKPIAKDKDSSKAKPRKFEAPKESDTKEASPKGKIHPPGLVPTMEPVAAPQKPREEFRIESKPKSDFKFKAIKSNDAVKLTFTFKHFCYENWKKMVEAEKKPPVAVKKVEEDSKQVKKQGPSYAAPSQPAMNQPGQGYQYNQGYNNYYNPGMMPYNQYMNNMNNFNMMNYYGNYMSQFPMMDPMAMQMAGMMQMPMTGMNNMNMPGMGVMGTLPGQSTAHPSTEGTPSAKSGHNADKK